MVERIHVHPIEPASTSPYASDEPLFRYISGTTESPNHEWAIVYHDETDRLILAIDGELRTYVDSLHDGLDTIAHLGDPHWPPARRDREDNPLPSTRRALR
jgi:hypothetical protein